MTKKSVRFALFFALFLGFAACGDDTDPTPTDDSGVLIVDGAQPSTTDGGKKVDSETICLLEEGGFSAQVVTDWGSLVITTNCQCSLDCYCSGKPERPPSCEPEGSVAVIFKGKIIGGNKCTKDGFLGIAIKPPPAVVKGDTIVLSISKDSCATNQTTLKVLIF